MIVETIVVGDLQTNCYLVYNETTKAGILIDPGADELIIKSFLKKTGVSLAAVILTHGHYDHIGIIDKFNVPVYIQEKDYKLLGDSASNLSAVFGRGKIFKIQAELLKEQKDLILAGLKFKVLYTPGHTPGGICLQIGSILFSGDTLFFHGVGRTDLPGGSFKHLMQSIKTQLLVLEPKTKVFPGHGPPTTIFAEIKENEYA
ncbi:MAG: MBL fold metallo-hydrolase [Candidatus Omnitrophota bacterium]